MFSKKHSKWKYRTDLYRNEKDGVKMMAYSIMIYIFCQSYYPKEDVGARNVLKYNFCMTEGSRVMKFGMVVNYLSLNDL